MTRTNDNEYQVDSRKLQELAKSNEPAKAMELLLAGAAQAMNELYFDSELQLPEIKLGRSNRVMGSYSSPVQGSKHSKRPGRIRISANADYPLLALLHELVHAWQYQHGEPVGHNPGFQEMARKVGIWPYARGRYTYGEILELKLGIQITQALGLGPVPE
ncbi:MAG: hypothetical protein DDT19_00262 [Syntrophomonadaceae bacterium]|nr:hypothetical protein [Bacillota bacterium]